MTCVRQRGLAGMPLQFFDDNAIDPHDRPLFGLLSALPSHAGSAAPCS